MEETKQTFFFKKLVYLLDIEVFATLINKPTHALLWDYPRFCDIERVKTQLDFITSKTEQEKIRHDLIMCCYYDILQKNTNAVQNGRIFKFKDGTKVEIEPELMKKDGGCLKPDFVVYDSEGNIMFILDVKINKREGGKRLKKYEQFVSDISKLHAISSDFNNSFYFQNFFDELTEHSRSHEFYSACLKLLELEFTYWESCKTLGYIVGNNRGIRQATEFRFNLLYKEVENIYQRMENLGFILDKLSNLERQVSND